MIPSLTLPDGRTVELDEDIVLGRAPVAPDAFPSARSISISAPTVSKTHAIIGHDATGVWIIDLNSSNGTEVISPTGSPSSIAAGVRTPVPDGANLRLGTDTLVPIQFGEDLDRTVARPPSKPEFVPTQPGTDGAPLGERAADVDWSAEPAPPPGRPEPPRHDAAPDVGVADGPEAVAEAVSPPEPVSALESVDLEPSSFAPEIDSVPAMDPEPPVAESPAVPSSFAPSPAADPAPAVEAAPPAPSSFAPSEPAAPAFDPQPAAPAFDPQPASPSFPASDPAPPVGGPVGAVAPPPGVADAPPVNAPFDPGAPAEPQPPASSTVAFAPGSIPPGPAGPGGPPPPGAAPGSPPPPNFGGPGGPPAPGAGPGHGAPPATPQQFGAAPGAAGFTPGPAQTSGTSGRSPVNIVGLVILMLWGLVASGRLLGLFLDEGVFHVSDEGVFQESWFQRFFLAASSDELGGVDADFISTEGVELFDIAALPGFLAFLGPGATILTVVLALAALVTGVGVVRRLAALPVLLALFFLAGIVVTVARVPGAELGEVIKYLGPGFVLPLIGLVLSQLPSGSGRQAISQAGPTGGPGFAPGPGSVGHDYGASR